MIDLRTGVPGSGKTLSAVEALSKMVARWGKHPDEARSIFVHGVKDLAIPHAALPLVEVFIGKIKYEVPDWSLVPDGSYVLIDECQSIFPPRASGSAMPDHVAFLNTHRHRGFDITLITQHPRLIDTAARALVGKHQHYRRLFGGSRAAVYEWDSCSDNLGGLANAVTSYYPYPKKAFKFYKSAEVHTKQNFRIPKWVFVPILGIVGGCFAFPFAYARVSGMADGGKAHAAIVAAGASPIPSASAPKISASAANVLASAPNVRGGLDQSLPVVVPTFAGCMAMRSRCECLGQDGRLVEVEPDRCRDNVAQSGKDIPYVVASASPQVLPQVTQALPVVAPSPAAAASTDKH